MALYLMVFLGGTPFGAPLIGWVGEELGARWSLIAGGGLSILGTLLCVAVFLHLRARRQAPLEVPGSEQLLRLPG
jgi:MFS family permease